MTEEKEVIAESNGLETNGGEDSEPSDMEKAIIRQVEYYFGDINLCRDKFLQEQVDLDDGWVPLELLIKFNRLATITMDTELIAKALQKSTSGLLELSEDNKKIRRNPDNPIPEMNDERRKEISNRSLYLKGFPKEATLDELLKYFKQFEEVENVIMRKYVDRATKRRVFKGSVFITFKTKEQADKFMENDSKNLKYDDTELIVHWQNDYTEIKQAEFNERKEKKDKKKGSGASQPKEQKSEFKLPTGTVLKFNGGLTGVTRENLKEGLMAIDSNIEVSYIDYKTGDAEGVVRFSKQDGAKEFMKNIENGTVTAGPAELSVELMTEQEETEYLAKTIEEMSKRRRQTKNTRLRKSFRNKHGKKRQQGDHEDAPSAKVKASS